MNPGSLRLGIALLFGHACLAPPGAAGAAPAQPASAAGMPAAGAPDGADSAGRAERRYEEMLGKMQAAVEEIAQLYGNPVFLQVFTNDAERAAELKDRLRAARSDEDVRRELAAIEKKRDDLMSDIALKEREAARLSSRLARQRAALDALAAAVEQARQAVEETTK
jgi:hypothetical protein